MPLRIAARLRPTAKRLRWLAIRALIAVVATYVGYLVVINVLLGTRLGKKLLNGADPAHAYFEYDSAYSLWFGSVHTKGFVVRGTDTAVEWRITTDEVSTTFTLRDFFRRRVHMRDTTAKGISVRVRFKVTAPTAEYLAKLPPIEGLPEPPIKPPEKPALTDENYNLWTVEIEHIAAEDFREVWVDSVRYTDAGGGSLDSGFYFKPMRLLRIDPTEYTARLGKIEIGKAVIATDIHGTFGLHVAEMDPRAPSGNEAFASIDAQAVAVARLVDLAWLDPMVGPGVALTEGGGPLEVSARLRQGVLEPGSRLDLRSEGWRAWSGDHWLSGTSIVHAGVASDTQGQFPRAPRAVGPPSTHPEIVVAVESYDVDLHHDKTHVAHAPAVNVIATFANTDLGASFQDWKAHIDVSSASVPKAEAMNAYFDTAYFYGGSARFSIHGDANPQGASGKFQTTLSNLSMQADEAVVKGSGTVDLTLRYLNFDTTDADFSLARFEFHDVSTGKQTGYWINASAAPFKLRLAGGPSIHAGISGKARDAQVPLAIVAAPGILGTLVGNQPFTFAAGLHLTSTTLNLTDLRLFGSSVELRGHYLSDAHGKNGAMLVSTSAVNVGLEMRKGSLSVRPLASRAWYAQTGT